MSVPKTTSVIYSNRTEDEAFLQDLETLKEAGDKRYIGITLDYDDPLWKDFFSFLCVYNLDMETAVKHILKDWLNKEKRKMQRASRKRELVCKECGCKRWIRRRRVGRDAYNLRCIKCGSLMKATKNTFSTFSDEDLKKMLPLEKGKI